VIINWLRPALASLLLFVPLSAHAQGRDSLPVTIVPNLVNLGWDTHADLVAASSRLIVSDRAGLYVFDVAAKRLVRRTLFDNFAKSRVLTPDEATVITGHMDGKIRLWNLATGASAGVLQEKAVKDGETYEITALAASADGALVSGSEDGTISVWNPKTRQKVRGFSFGEVKNGPSSRILALRVSRDNKTLIAVVLTAVRTFDFATGKQLSAYDLPNEKFKTDYSFFADSIISDDGLIAQFTAPGCELAELRYLDLRDFGPLPVDKPAACKRPEEESYDFGEVSLFVNAARSTILIARTGGAELKQWDFKARVPGRTIKWPKDEKPELIGVDKDFTRAVSNIDGRISVRALEDGVSVAAFDTNTYPAEAAIRSRDGKSILLAQAIDKKEQQLTLWEVGSPDPRLVLRVPADGDTTIRDFSQESMLAAAITKDGFLLLSLETGKEVRRWTQKEIKEPWIIRLTPDGKLALLSGDDPDGNTATLLVDTSDGSVKHVFNQTRDGGKKKDDDEAFSVSDAAFSADGKRFALGRFDGSAEIWDVATLKRIKALPLDEKDSPGQIWSPVFSADGKKLLTCSRDSGAMLWTIDSGKQPRAFLYDDYAAGHAHLGSAALSHDGTMVAAGSTQHAVSSGDTGHERSVKIWNAASGKLRLSWPGHENGVTAVTFSADDHRVISASHDGTIKYWDSQTGKELASIIVTTDGHWVVLSPSGLFSGNAGDSNLFNLARGLSARPSADFREALYKPDLIAELLKGDPSHRYAAAAKQVDLEKVWEGAK
jgi:WD40 repeat protein